MADQYKPPVKPSQLRWIFWLDHSRDTTTDKDAPIAPRELQISIGWLQKENDEVTQEAYCVSTTGEIDILKISKKDIQFILPVIKPHKEKEK